MMPWSAEDAPKHTKKATTEALRRLWAKVANESLAKDGPGKGNEGEAVRKANSAVAKHHRSAASPQHAIRWI